MTNSRPSITGRDVAGAGVFLLTVNLVCAALGAGLGALAVIVFAFTVQLATSPFTRSRSQ